MAELVVNRRPATLPNCDCCGRFTARPTFINTSWSGAGTFACAELLLCPYCATNCKTTLTHRRRHD